jgi:hypothetical protein
MCGRRRLWSILRYCARFLSGGAEVRQISGFRIRSSDNEARNLKHSTAISGLKFIMQEMVNKSYGSSVAYLTMSRKQCYDVTTAAVTSSLELSFHRKLLFKVQCTYFESWNCRSDPNTINFRQTPVAQISYVNVGRLWKLPPGLALFTIIWLQVTWA